MPGLCKPTCALCTHLPQTSSHPAAHSFPHPQGDAEHAEREDKPHGSRQAEAPALAKTVAGKWGFAGGKNNLPTVEADGTVCVRHGAAPCLSSQRPPCSTPAPLHCQQPAHTEPIRCPLGIPARPCCRPDLPVGMAAERHGWRKSPRGQGDPTGLCQTSPSLVLLPTCRAPEGPAHG